MASNSLPDLMSLSPFKALGTLLLFGVSLLLISCGGKSTGPTVETGDEPKTTTVETAPAPTGATEIVPSPEAAQELVAQFLAASSSNGSMIAISDLARPFDGLNSTTMGQPVADALAPHLEEMPVRHFAAAHRLFRIGGEAYQDQYLQRATQVLTTTNRYDRMSALFTGIMAGPYVSANHRQFVLQAAEILPPIELEMQYARIAAHFDDEIHKGIVQSGLKRGISWIALKPFFLDPVVGEQWQEHSGKAPIDFVEDDLERLGIKHYGESYTFTNKYRLGEQGLHHRADLARRESGGADDAFAVDDKIGRPKFHLPRGGGAIVHAHGIVEFLFFGHRGHSFETLAAVVHPDEHQAVFPVGFDEFDVFRQGRDARPAPRPPKINHHHLALELGQIRFVTNPIFHL